MGFTDDNLPPEREIFWRGRSGKAVAPIHGILKTEWWPTKNEFFMVDKFYYENKLANDLLIEYFPNFKGEFEDVTFYSWLTRNFCREEYTNDYTELLTEEMLLTGFKEFLQEKQDLHSSKEA